MWVGVFTGRQKNAECGWVCLQVDRRMLSVGGCVYRGRQNNAHGPVYVCVWVFLLCGRACLCQLMIMISNVCHLVQVYPSCTVSCAHTMYMYTMYVSIY